MNYNPLIPAATVAAALGLATVGTAEAHDHGGWGGGGFGPSIDARPATEAATAIRLT